jgi:hypothetical protein
MQKPQSNVGFQCSFQICRTFTINPLDLSAWVHIKMGMPPFWIWISNTTPMKEMEASESALWFMAPTLIITFIPAAKVIFANPLMEGCPRYGMASSIEGQTAEIP